jgi:hypothetical protein
MEISGDKINMIIRLYELKLKNLYKYENMGLMFIQKYTETYNELHSMEGILNIIFDEEFLSEIRNEIYDKEFNEIKK